jgi:pyruvate kinase
MLLSHDSVIQYTHDMKRKSNPSQNAPPHLGVAQLLKEMRALRSNSLESQKQSLEHWKPYLHLKGFHSSAANLAAYIGLRRHDVRHLQCQLADLGLSSLGRCEAHVLPSLDAVIRMLKIMHGEDFDAEEMSHTRAAMDNAEKLLRKHTDRLLGPPPSHRWARIMVTLPSEASRDYVFVRELVLRGMDCARINCAHDELSAWQHMVQFVHQAEQETGRNCKILMDIAGPKLRTGPASRRYSMKMATQFMQPIFPAPCQPYFLFSNSASGCGLTMAGSAPGWKASMLPGRCCASPKPGRKGKSCARTRD